MACFECIIALFLDFLELRLQLPALLLASKLSGFESVLLILSHALRTKVDGLHTARKLQRVAGVSGVPNERTGVNQEEDSGCAKRLLKQHSQPCVAVGHECVLFCDGLDNISESTEAFVDCFGL